VGDGGLRFPPGQVHALAQRMRSALESPEIIVQYGIAARRRALDLFSEQRMVKEYFDLYRRVTGFDETDPKARHAL